MTKKKSHCVWDQKKNYKLEENGCNLTYLKGAPINKKREKIINPNLIVKWTIVHRKRNKNTSGTQEKIPNFTYYKRNAN